MSWPAGLKKKKKHQEQKRVLLVPLSLEISYFGLVMQGIKAQSQSLKLQTPLIDVNSSTA